jgi:hypothetical protein
MKSIGRAFLIYTVIAATFASCVQAADLATIDRTVKREPIYRSKAPRYALLVFGADAQKGVWLVQDGDVLYVDRKGNGDLTDPANKVSAKPVDKENEDSCLYFEAGDLNIGGRVHKRLSVSASLLNRYTDPVKERPNAKAALSVDPTTRVFRVALDVDWPGLKGEHAGGRVRQIAGILDMQGVFLFAATPAEAPIIHFGGPLQVTFYGEKPALKLDRTSEVVLVVGTPGLEAGTFASLGYEGTVPTAVHPRIEIEFPSAAQQSSPLRASLELKMRC